MEKRIQQLEELGFEKENTGLTIYKVTEEYISYKAIGEIKNSEWNRYIESIKTSPKSLEKRIRDLYNAKNSELKQMTNVKLSKIINEDNINRLRIETELLRSLL